MYNHAGAEGLGLKGLRGRAVGPSLLSGAGLLLPSVHDYC